MVWCTVASSPAARDYVWSRIRAGYLVHNITLFFLDASEPQPPILDRPDCPQFNAGLYSSGMRFQR